MITKKIYLTGADFHEMEELFTGLTGVISTRVGYLNTNIEEPTYDSVASGEAGGFMGVEIIYDPKKIDLSRLLDLHFTAISPYQPNGQGFVRGEMYQAGVFYVAAEDEPQIALHLSFLAGKGKPAATGACLTINDPNSSEAARRILHAKMKTLTSFKEAEPEHQTYLKKNPNTETFIDFSRWRELIAENKL